MKLDPESRSYRMNLAYTLLNNGQAEQARAVAEKLAATATSEEDSAIGEVGAGSDCGGGRVGEVGSAGGSDAGVWAAG